jgi:hypothetical protein
VTGKRKRGPSAAAVNENEQQRISHSVDFRSERLRNRALRQQSVNDQLDKQPSTSSTSVPQTGRTIKTRRTAFIASSEGEEEGSPRSEIEKKPPPTLNDRTAGKLVKRGTAKKIKIELEEEEPDDEDRDEPQSNKKSSETTKRFGISSIHY